MKSLVLFACAALFGSIHCNSEPQSERLCFESAAKECWKPLPRQGTRLCYEIRDQILCLAEKLENCRAYNIWIQALDLRGGVNLICDDYLKKKFDEDKICFQYAIVDHVCSESINEANKNIRTLEDFIRANKKTCSLYEPYSKCVTENVVKNCNNTVISHDLFKELFDPLRKLTNSFCEELIIPADEQDSQPDNFGIINVYQSVLAVFNSA